MPTPKRSRDLEIENDLTLAEVLAKVKERCDGNPHEWGSTEYNGEIYGICSTDCADCGVSELLRLIIDVNKRNSENI